MNKFMWIGALASVVIISGCMATPQPKQVRPVMTCDDCKGLAYYGPQDAPGPDPRVQMAKTITSGIVSVAGIGAGAYGVNQMAGAATSIVGTVAGAGKYAIVEQPSPTIVTQPDPTIVTQPEPIIVDPPETVIVNPEVVDPVVVTP